MPAFREERWDEAIALMEEGLAEKPGNPALLYNLACAESRAGRVDAALATSGGRRSRRTGSTAERAAKDPDFDPIREQPGFPK